MFTINQRAGFIRPCKLVKPLTYIKLCMRSRESVCKFPLSRMPITLYSELGCTGSSKDIKDSEVNLAKVGVKFPVKSASVDGNPFILFSEERYQGFLAYLEEGRYEDLGALGLPADYKIASVKYKKESLASPQIRLFNSSTFAGKSKISRPGQLLVLTD